jgi:hypothetical protein
MGAKEHYDTHLAGLYAWMAGDFETGVSSFTSFLDKHDIPKGEGKLAIDLGAGHGMQSVALARRGFEVKAIDFSERLLSELKEKDEKKIECINADLKDFQSYCPQPVALINCWGDTLTHLTSLREVEDLLGRASYTTERGGHLLLSFRDYTVELKDNHRFISVKSEEKRLLTCMLEYFPMYVKVSDLYQEYKEGAWTTKVSSYLKLRLEPSEVIEMLEENDFMIKSSGNEGGQVGIVAVKK